MAEGKWLDIDYAKQKSLKEMIERYDKEYTAYRTYYPQKRERSIFKHLYCFFGDTVSLAEVSQKVGSYEQHRKTQGGAKPGTILREIGVLRLMFNTARKQWKWKIENPVSDIELPKVRNERVRYLFDDEYRRLFEALETAEKWLSDIVTTGLDTGLRLTNLCDLKWS